MRMLGARPRGEQAAGDAVNILLVDDLPANLLVLEAVLGDLGQNLVRANSGEEALRLLDRQEFAVVLLDVRMPGMNGFETAGKMRAWPKTVNTPIIFISAHASDEFPIIDAYKLGAVDFLVKPLVPEILRAKVAGFIELTKERDRARREAEIVRLIIHNTKDYAIFMLDPQGRVTTWNMGAERLKGYRADEIIGQHFSRFYPQEDIDRGWPEHELAVAVETGRFEDEGWRLRKDGSRLWANVVITTLRSESGEVLGFSKITRDLTERKVAEENARRLTAEQAAREQLKLAEQRKDEFLAMLGHELRNPLAPLRSALQLMKMQGATSEMISQARDTCERQVQHMVRLVDDLLDVSRVMRGRIEIRRETVELADMIRHGAEIAQPMIDSHGQKLLLSLPDKPLYLNADPARLAQVISNLLHNAAKFSPHAGRIWLSLAEQGTQAVIKIKDEGAGIRADLLPHIFDLFVQGDSALERSQGGLGIGLTVVRRLIEMHGGEVKVASEGMGLGAEFTITLPGLRQPQQPAPKASKPALATPRRVLIVDDNVDSADMLALLLKNSGHEIRLAHSGPAALAAAQEFLPELVLLDIGLPGMSGYDVARALRQQKQFDGTVLAALTGYGQEGDRTLSLEAGFDLHYVKPLSPKTLQALLADPRGAIS
jgi:PAS domain S-box-containing protein